MPALSCKFISYWLDEAVKIMMQVFFVVTFLSLFFFLYVVRVEKEIFISQINFVVDDVVDTFQRDLATAVPVKDAREQIELAIGREIQTFQPEQGNYPNIMAANRDVMDQTKRIVFLLGVVLFSVMVAVVVYGFCTHFSYQVFENLLTLGFLGLTEFLFLNLVTRDYIAVNPNHVRYFILNSIQVYAEGKQNW
jgi:hypothetical protein